MFAVLVLRASSSRLSRRVDIMSVMQQQWPHNSLQWQCILTGPPQWHIDIVLICVVCLSVRLCATHDNQARLSYGYYYMSNWNSFFTICHQILDWKKHFHQSECLLHCCSVLRSFYLYEKIPFNKSGLCSAQPNYRLKQFSKRSI